MNKNNKIIFILSFMVIFLLVISSTIVQSDITALKDGDGSVRRGAVYALAETEDERAFEALITALKDGNEPARQDAAIALGKLGDERAVEALITALKDWDALVRQYAAIALGKLGDERAVEALITALKDWDGTVRRGAAYALSLLGNQISNENINKLVYIMRNGKENWKEMFRGICGVSSFHKETINYYAADVLVDSKSQYVDNALMAEAKKVIARDKVKISKITC